MVTSANDFIAWIDRHYTYQIIIRAYTAAFGKQPDEMTGKPLQEVYALDIIKNTLKPFWTSASEEKKAQFKSWFDFPASEQRHIDGACHPIFGADHSVTGMVLIKRDTTRTKTLANQLIQSQKMKAVKTLAGGIAHDFDNLLMGIQGVFH